MSFDELIRHNIIKGWDWYKLSMNPNITMEIITDNPYILFEKKGLLQNPSITIQNIETNIQFFEENIEYIVCNDNITIEHIERHNDIPWDFMLLSKNKSIPLDFIEKNIDEEWSWEDLSSNKNLTVDFIKKYSHKPFNWKIISAHECIKWEDIIDNDLPWDRQGVSLNPNITWQIVKTNPDYKWCFKMLSANKNITFNIIKNNLNYNWCSEYIAKNDNVTFDTMKNDFILKNYMRYFSANRNLTPKIIMDNPDINWNFNEISSNPMDQPLFSQEYNIKYSQYRQEKIIDFMKKINDELIAVSWHPNRYFKWVIDRTQMYMIEHSSIS